MLPNVSGAPRPKRIAPWFTGIIITKSKGIFSTFFAPSKGSAGSGRFFKRAETAETALLWRRGAGFLTAAEQTHRCAAVGAFQHIGAAVPAEVRFFQAGKTAPLPAVQNRRKLAWSVASFLSAQTLKRR